MPPYTQEAKTTAQSERRAFTRHPTHIAASVAIAGNDDWTCLIRDYCSGGLLLVAPGGAEVPAYLSSGDSDQPLTIDIGFMLQTPEGSTIVSVKGYVAHVGEKGVGVAFIRQEKDLCDSLIEHDRYTQSKLSLPVQQASSVHDAPGVGKPMDRDKLAQVLAGVVNEHFPPLLAAAITQTEQTLFRKTEEPLLDSNRISIMRDLNSIAQHGNEFTNKIIQKLHSLVETVRTEEVTLDATDALDFDGELHLMDEMQFEDWLATSDLISQLETLFASTIDTLKQQFHLRKDKLGRNLSVPFLPADIGELIRDISTELNLSSFGHAAFYKVVTQLLRDKLKFFYQALSQELIIIGYLPITKPVLKRSTKTDIRQSSFPISSTGGNRDPNDPIVGNAASDHSSVDYVSQHSSARDRQIEDVLQVLTALQQNENPRELSVAQLTHEMIQSIGKNHTADKAEQFLAAPLRERIATTGKLLQSIYEDKQVTSSAKPWLEQLKVLVMQAAVSNPKFFQTKKHPILKIANQLEHMGMFISDSKDASDEETEGVINQLLKQIAAVGGNEQEQLNSLADQLSAMEQSYVETYQRNVDRVVAASEGQYRTRQARQAVQQELMDRYGGREIPKPLMELLKAGWQSLLQLSYIRSGQGGNDWSHNWKILDSLESALSQPGPLGKTNQVANSELLSSIEKGLNYASFDSFHKVEIMEALKEKLEGNSQPEVEWIQYGIESDQRDLAHGALTDQAKSIVVPTDISEKAWQAALKEAGRIQPGDSVTVLGSDGAEKLRRVAWRDKAGQQIVLVNPRGARTEILSVEDVAMRFAQGKAFTSKNADMRLVERASNSMLREMEDRLSFEVVHEPVTGLHNRRYLASSIERVIALARKGVNVFSLLFIDLDQFKAINNAYGFEAGDKLLVVISELIQDVFSNAEVVASLGGDQFGILLSGASEAAIIESAESLRTRVQSFPFIYGGRVLPLESSIGIVFIHQMSKDANSIMSAANSACVAAKESGQNRVLVYRNDNELISRQKQSMDWLVRVNDALEHDRFRLRCHKIAPLDDASGRQAHYEVLLTVFDDDDNQISLEKFIEAAEYYNRMGVIDKVVIRKTLAFMADNPSVVESSGGFAINLSGNSLSDVSLVDYIANELYKTCAPAEKICFEITETVAIKNITLASEIIGKVKKLGCTIALDDFGSGMSSYSYLRNLPIDFVKIDGAFVREITDKESDYVVVKSINEISHFLGKETIAEYVENKKIAACLHELGVDYAQGYGIEKPFYMEELMV